MALTTNQGLDIPDGTDNANVPLSFTNYNTGVENRLVQRYLSIADRTARNAAPFEGELSYLLDLDRFEKYTGTAWIPLIPAYAQAAVATLYTSTSAPYTATGAALVGGSVTVPPSGIVEVNFTGFMSNSAGGTTLLAPQLNTGAVIGAGALLVAPSDDASISVLGTNEIRTSSFVFYTGLTAGNVVNAFLTHRVTGFTGTFARRGLKIEQA